MTQPFSPPKTAFRNTRCATAADDLLSHDAARPWSALWNCGTARLEAGMVVGLSHVTFDMGPGWESHSSPLRRTFNLTEDEIDG
jgi:hypothetical protein